MSTSSTEEQAFCIRCEKTPPDILEYSPEMTGEKLDADTYVWRNEGTLNKSNGHFYCTDCYIKVGMPLGVAP